MSSLQSSAKNDTEVLDIAGLHIMCLFWHVNLTPHPHVSPPPRSDSDSPTKPRAYGHHRGVCAPEVPERVETWAAKIAWNSAKWTSKVWNIYSQRPLFVLKDKPCWGTFSSGGRCTNADIFLTWTCPVLSLHLQNYYFLTDLMEIE